MIDCPCGFGKNVPDGQPSCPACGTDLTPLHRLKEVPQKLYNEGARLLVDKRPSQAAEKFAAAISLDPAFSSAHRALGQIYLEKGIYEEAIRHLSQASILEPEDKHLKAEMKKAETASQITTKSKRRAKAKSWLIPLVGFLLGLSIIPLIRLTSPSPQSHPSGDILASRISDRLVGHPLLAKYRFQVEYTPTGLSLSGEVPTNLHKNLVYEIARNVAEAMPIDDSDLRIAPPQAEPSPKRDVFVYRVKTGDSLAAIAKKFYGQEKIWPRIFEANKDTILSADSISPGQALVIPLENDQAFLTPIKKIP